MSDAKFNISGYDQSSEEESISHKNAIVPVVNIINETLASSSAADQNYDIESAISIKDVNSTTNLLEMTTSKETLAHFGKLKAPQVQVSNNLLKPIAKTDINNSSQSSIDSSIKFGDETDMIPLMPINLNGAPLSPIITETVHEEKHSDERWYIILVQVLLPFFIAGFGMVAAGVVLDIVQHWELYVNIKAIFTLIPALLGLKGNLEMTLASRFSTQVNIGKIRDKSTILSAVLGNFALTQAQAIIVGFLASVGALALKVVTKTKEDELDFKNALVLISGCMSTASFASLALAGLMMFIIILSKKLNINPDNIATPIAASLGDLVTLTILTFLCQFLYQIKFLIWIHILIILMFIILIPIFIYYSYRNDFVKDALYNGWIPILSAMAISSVGGFIMGSAIATYQDIAVFQPVVNGVGGNLVAIFASRLSTALHRTSIQGSVPSWAPLKWYSYPYHTFFGKLNPESKTALVLAAISVPGHLLFYFTITKIKVMQENHLNVATLTPAFITFYTSISILQVILLLLICYWLVHLAWRRNQNPDNVCIPYLTAIGDFLGTLFLALCFHGLYLAGEKRLRSD